MLHGNFYVLFIELLIFCNAIDASEITDGEWETRFASLEKLVLTQDARISELESEIKILKQGCSTALYDKAQRDLPSLFKEGRPDLSHEKSQLEQNVDSANDEHPGASWESRQNRNPITDSLTIKTHKEAKPNSRIKSDFKHTAKQIPFSLRFLPGNNPIVAFQASIAENGRTVIINEDSTIVFDTVSMNIGGAYHSRHGLFVASVKGIYIFSTSVAATSINTILHVDIEKNGIEIAGGVAYDKDGTYHQCSVTVVVDLIAGDEVFVSIERHSSITIYGDKLTSFMGVLLYPLKLKIIILVVTAQQSAYSK